MSTLDTYIKKFCREMEIPPFVASSQDTYSFPFDERCDVNITLVDQGLYFSSMIAPCPPKEEEAFFTYALHGNLFGEGTVNATLGLNEKGDTLVLSRVFDPNLTYDDFKNGVEDFMNAIEFWQTEARDFERQ